MASTTDKNYQKILSEVQSIYSIAPTQSSFSWGTQLYKKMTSPLKTMPFILLIPLAVISAVTVMSVLGHFANQLTSLLQIAF